MQGKNVLVDKVIMFGFNYPHNFINKIWVGNIADHLNSKFIDCYDKHGSKAAFQMFYIGLDMENRGLLIDWIEHNFKG